jgi:hypothetical protein
MTVDVELDRAIPEGLCPAFHYKSLVPYEILPLGIET